MQYWNSLLTDKSWNALLKLKKEPIKFILIGGWAVFLWTQQIKSKDIDIIITNFDDLSYLKQRYTLNKNNKLKKYEMNIENIDVDLYLIHYSQLGIPIKEICDKTSSINGIELPNPYVLLILKQTAELSRRDTIKGKKDQIDILTILFYSEIDFVAYKKLLEEYKLDGYIKRLKTIVKTFKDIKYLNLNPREFKLKKQALLKKIDVAHL